MDSEEHTRSNNNPDDHIFSFLFKAVNHKENQKDWCYSTLAPKKVILGKLCDGIAKSKCLNESKMEISNRHEFVTL